MQISFPKHIESKQSTENKKKMQKRKHLSLFCLFECTEQGGKKNSSKAKMKKKILFNNIVQTKEGEIQLRKKNSLVDFAIFTVNQLKLYIYFLIINYSAVGKAV